MTKTLQPRYRAVLFDLDGTIANTLPDLTAGVNYVLAAYGYPLRSQSEVASFVGDGMMMLVRRAFPVDTNEQTLASAYQKFMQYYGAHFADTTRPYRGIVSLLKSLLSAGVKIAVVSNKADEMTVPLVAGLFPSTFCGVVGNKENVPRKPNPTAVWNMLNQIGANREETCYVGDSEVDVQTAQNAGMDCVSVTWGFRTKEQLLAAGATRIADTVGQLKAELFYNKENDHA